MITESLRDAGYMTAAIGKWGMGSGTGAPWNHGIDYFVGYMETKDAWWYYPTSLAMFVRPPFSNEVPADNVPDKFDINQWVSTLGAVTETRCAVLEEDCAYSSDTLRNFSLAYIQQFINPTQNDYTRPFFLYWTPATPHVGSYQDGGILTSPAGNLSNRVGQTTMCKRGHASEIEVSIDADVSAVLDLLDSTPTLKNTLFIFATDNGPHADCADDPSYGPPYYIAAGGLRGMKRTLYEGGSRSPTIIRWPDVIAAGGTNAIPHTFADIAVTLLHIAGAKPLPATGKRGAPGGAVNILDAWKSSDSPPTRTTPIMIEWCDNNMPDMCTTACYDTTKWPVSLPKLIRFPDGSFEMYELVSDPIEENNIASSSPLFRPLLAKLLASREPLCQVAAVYQSPECKLSVFPTTSPTVQPTARPSNKPTLSPSRKPSKSPAVHPSRAPTTLEPSESPSVVYQACVKYDVSLVGNALPINFVHAIGAQNRYHANGCPSQSSNYGNAEPELVSLFEAPLNGVFYFDSIGSQVDTILYVINCTSEAQVACDDDGFGPHGLQSRVGPLALGQGERVAVVIDVYGTQATSALANVQLNVYASHPEYEQDEL